MLSVSWQLFSDHYHNDYDKKKKLKNLDKIFILPSFRFTDGAERDRQ